MTDQMTDEKPAPAPDTHPETRQGLLLPIAIPIGAFVVIALVLFGFSRVLLSVSAHAATVVALIVAVSIMVVATIVASRERLSNGALFSMVGVVAGVAMLAGGIAIVAIGTGEEAGGGEPRSWRLRRRRARRPPASSRPRCPSRRTNRSSSTSATRIRASSTTS